MSMADDHKPRQETEIDRLVRITNMSKQEIKLLSYLGKTTDEIIQLSKNHTQN